MPIASTRKKAPARKALRGDPVLPATRTRRERVHVLNVPFKMRAVAQASRGRWDPELKGWVYEGDDLPEGLTPFASQPYSIERWREEIANGIDDPAPVPCDEAPIVLREHQVVAKDMIQRAMIEDRPGFVLCDDVGVGKSASAVEAALEDPDVETILIVCPLHAVAHWRRTISRLGDRGKRCVVINYDRLKTLFSVDQPLPTRRRKKAKRGRTLKGVARFGKAFVFDFVILDESQKLRRLESARSKLGMKIADAADFTAWLSATAGQSPLELAYLAKLLCEATGDKVGDLKAYEEWAKSKGFHLGRVEYGRWAWAEARTPEGEPDPAESRRRKEEDLERMRTMLFDGPSPLGLRRTPEDIAGWPAMQRVLTPVELDPEDRIAYEQAWSTFRSEQGLSPAATRDTRNALVRQLRFRQKSSLLRTAATRDLANSLLEQGRAVAISVAFLDTAEVLRTALSEDGHRCAVIAGSDARAKEEARVRFQKGVDQVVIYTVEDAISLHDGEYPDAVRRPRANLLHDLRWSGIVCKQIEGRCHRNGELAICYWMYGAGTVEERIAKIMAERLRDIGAMKGDDALRTDIDRILGTF